MELKEILKEAVIVSENASFQEALDTMLAKHTNTLLVTNDEGVLTGEVSVSDLFDGIIPMDFDGDDVLTYLKDEGKFAEVARGAAETPVFDFMSTDFSSVHPDGSIMEVAAVAVAHQRARIPVVDHENRPVGIISRQGLKQILGKFLADG